VTHHPIERAWLETLHRPCARQFSTLPVGASEEQSPEATRPRFCLVPYLCRRALRVPFGGAFVCCAGANQRRFAEQAAYKL
jgi:hypothetical protein